MATIPDDAIPVYQSQRCVAYLTIEYPPTLRIEVDGMADWPDLAADDRLPSGMFAGELVERAARRWEPDDPRQIVVAVFLAGWPETVEAMAGVGAFGGT